MIYSLNRCAVKGKSVIDTRITLLKQSQPWRFCPNCDDYHYRLVLLDETSTVVMVACKTCGAQWPLKCPMCGAGVEGLREIVNTSGHVHVVATCDCGYADRGNWNIGQRTRGTRRYLAFRGRPHACATCGTPGSEADLEVDHVTPLAMGGLDIVANMQLLCRPCHGRKTVTEFPGWKRT